MLGYEACDWRLLTKMAVVVVVVAAMAVVVVVLFLVAVVVVVIPLRTIMRMICKPFMLVQREAKKKSGSCVANLMIQVIDVAAIVAVLVRKTAACYRSPSVAVLASNVAEHVSSMVIFFLQV